MFSIKTWISTKLEQNNPIANNPFASKPAIEKILRKTGNMCNIRLSDKHLHSY